jgi:benzoate transport
MNIKSLIDDHPMTGLQYSVVVVCFLMNMLDGMDVLIMSYTAPAIAKAWGTGPEALGAVFSSGLLGMTIGTLFISPLADRIGRKKMMLISALIMGVCIYLNSYATSVNHLLIFRFVSGLGIGSMLATTAALIAEYTPHKTKDFWVSAAIAGYPTGAVVSGLVAAKVIPLDGWAQMFKYAGYASIMAVPVVLIFLYESIDYYLKGQPDHALGKINQILNKMGHTSLSALPELPPKQAAIPLDKLLHTEYKQDTMQLWAALFMAFATLYFLTSWIPKLASNAGLPLHLAIYAGTVFNIGAFFGIMCQGYLSTKFGLKKTLGYIFIFTSVLMVSFNFFAGSGLLLLIFGLLGFGIQGGFVGLYAAAARMYPTALRATGVGWAMGAGRLGGIVGPALGGILIGAGLSMTANFLVFAVPALFAGLITMRMKSKEVS